jgi:hypothetical protein
MGFIFVTAGERSVACGSAKVLNLPEWAKLFCVFVLPFRAGLPVRFVIRRQGCARRAVMKIRLFKPLPAFSKKVSSVWEKGIDVFPKRYRRFSQKV